MGVRTRVTRTRARGPQGPTLIHWRHGGGPSGPEPRVLGIPPIAAANLGQAGFQLRGGGVGTRPWGQGEGVWGHACPWGGGGAGWHQARPAPGQRQPEDAGLRLDRAAWSSRAWGGGEAFAYQFLARGTALALPL